jgi:hypothetical protein
MRAIANTVYVVTVDPEPEWEDEMNRWYNEEHVPNLLKVPGYVGATRYVAIEGSPKYMNFYQIESLDAFRSPERQQAVNTPWSDKVRPHLKSQLAIYEQIFPDEGVLQGASWGPGTVYPGGLLVNRMDVSSEGEQDFNDWYNQEHLNALSQVEGNIASRRFRALEGSPRYMAIYELTEPAVQASAAWAKAVDTPWTARVRPNMQTRWRTVYKPLE